MPSTTPVPVQSMPSRVAMPTSELTKSKRVTFAPIPTARAATEARVKPFDFRRNRTA
jgi:hypothetical protein